MAKLFKLLSAKQKALGDIFDSVNSKFKQHMPPFSPPPIQVHYEERKTEEFKAEVTGCLYEGDFHDERVDARILSELSQVFVKEAISRGFMEINKYPLTQYPPTTTHRLSGRLMENKK